VVIDIEGESFGKHSQSSSPLFSELLLRDGFICGNGFHGYKGTKKYWYLQIFLQLFVQKINFLANRG